MPRAKNPQRQCPINGCRRTKEPIHVVCRTHWLRLSKADRERIWQLFKTERGSDNHLMAIQAAIEQLEAEEGFSQE